MMLHRTSCGQEPPGSVCCVLNLNLIFHCSGVGPRLKSEIFTIMLSSHDSISIDYLVRSAVYSILVKAFG